MRLLDKIAGPEEVRLARAGRSATHVHTTDSAILAEDYRTARAGLTISPVTNANPGDIGDGVDKLSHVIDKYW